MKMRQADVPTKVRYTLLRTKTCTRLSCGRDLHTPLRCLREIDHNAETHKQDALAQRWVT